MCLKRGINFLFVIMNAKDFHDQLYFLDGLTNVDIIMNIGVTLNFEDDDSAFKFFQELYNNGCDPISYERQDYNGRVSIDKRELKKYLIKRNKLF
jgi:hypothetical protein